MSAIASKLGYWSTVTCLFSILLFIIGFSAIIILHPVYEWTSFQDYILYNNNYDQSFKHLAQLSMLLFMAAFLVILNTLHFLAEAPQKLFTSISLHFGTAAMTLVSLCYFVQLTAVRWNFANNNAEGLEHFVQFYPDSAILSILMLGFTFFLGLASLFMVPVFQFQGSSKMVYWGFLLNGGFAILGLVGYVLQILPLIFISTNFGMGLGQIILFTGLLRWFRKL